MKKSHQKVSATIKVSPEAAWNVIGAVSGVDKWLAPIQTCRVEGSKRYCTTEAGEFSEDILKVDHANRQLEYAIPIQNMIPVRNIVGQMKVLKNQEDQTVVEWTWDFDVEETQEQEAKEMLAMVGNLGISGIESLIHNGGN